MQKKRILITGGYGSIGREILPMLKNIYHDEDIGITTKKNKGTSLHKFIGYTWIGLMFYVSVSTFLYINLEF